MRVEVPIVDTGGATVARFVWDGTLYDGRSWFEQEAATPEQADAAKNVIDRNQYLRNVHFRSIGARDTVRGWQGLEGTVGALRLALPAVGLDVGRYDPTDITGLAVDADADEVKQPTRLW
jgi:hypothetical protein